MNTLENKLVPVPLKCLPKLRDMYRVEWPTYITACYTIDTCIRWFDKDPNLKDVKIYCLNGKWEDGTFIMIVSLLVVSWSFRVFPVNKLNSKNLFQRETTHFFNTLQPSCENLKIALSLIDWLKPSNTSCYSGALRSTVLQVLNDQGIKNVSEFSTNIYFVPGHQALEMIKKVHVPEGITLKQLDKSHIKEIYEKYPHKAEDSLRTFELLVEMNPSMGAFSDSGELLAWVLRFVSKV